MRLSASSEPVRILMAVAAVAELAMRYVHSPLALAVLPVVVLLGSRVRKIVTPDASIETPTPAEFLDMAINASMPEGVETPQSGDQP